MTTTRTQFEASLFQDYSKNSKAIHRYLNMFTSSSVIPNQVNLNDTSATAPLDKANLFNQYFHSVYAPYSSTSDILIPRLSQLSLLS